MKPIKNSIPIRELQTLLRQWRRKGLTEGAILKVLELYLGLPNYMNEQGVYPVHFFYDLAASLKFRTAGNMLDAVRLTGNFGWEPGENKLNMGCFWSPLWKDLPDSTADVAANDAAKLLQNLQRDNIYNNIINNISTRHAASLHIPVDDSSTQHAASLHNSVDGSLTQHAASLHIPVDDSLTQHAASLHNSVDDSSTQHAASLHLPLDPSEEGRRFFQLIKANPAEKAEVLQPLIAFFQQQEPDLPREEACTDVVYLVNELLIPHFIAQERFLHMKHNGRVAWLKNLLKSSHGRELLKKAAEAGKQRRILHKQQALAEVKQKNRPLSPHEWTDPVSGTRFYEDESEGVVTIPKEAPPRPSETAFWNVIKCSWSF